jgi:hypothetical protein
MTGGTIGLVSISSKQSKFDALMKQTDEREKELIASCERSGLVLSWTDAQIQEKIRTIKANCEETRQGYRASLARGQAKTAASRAARRSEAGSKRPGGELGSERPPPPQQPGVSLAASSHQGSFRAAPFWASSASDAFPAAGAASLSGHPPFDPDSPFQNIQGLQNKGRVKPSDAAAAAAAPLHLPRPPTARICAHCYVPLVYAYMCGRCRDKTSGVYCSREHRLAHRDEHIASDACVSPQEQVEGCASEEEWKVDDDDEEDDEEE